MADHWRFRAAIDASAPTCVEIAPEFGAHAGRDGYPAGFVKFRIANEKDTALRIDIAERQAHELAAPKARGVEQYDGQT